MAIAPLGSSFYADPTALTALKREAGAQSPEALRETARQFESLFTTMMLKSMRDATPQDSMFGSDQQDFYQDMFDQQLSMQLSKGKGLGLADMLVRQLMQASGLPAEAIDQANAPGGAASSSNWPPRDREDFVRQMRPEMQEAGAKLGVDPDLLVAHAALETGWGQAVPADSRGRPGFNLFGVKAGSGWHGSTSSVQTNEFFGGSMQKVDAAFRAYESPADSIRDYVSLLSSNSRYAGALNTGSDAGAFARGLQQGGYATDPDYAKKLEAVAVRLKSHASQPISSNEA